MTASVNQKRSTSWLPYPAGDVDPLLCQDEGLGRRLDELDEFLYQYFTSQLADPSALAKLHDQYDTMLRHRNAPALRAADSAGNDVAA